MPEPSLGKPSPSPNAKGVPVPLESGKHSRLGLWPPTGVLLLASRGLGSNEGTGWGLWRAYFQTSLSTNKQCCWLPLSLPHYRENCLLRKVTLFSLTGGRDISLINLTSTYCAHFNFKTHSPPSNYRRFL